MLLRLSLLALLLLTVHGSWQDSPQLEAVAEHMEQEKEIMSAFDSALERMTQGDSFREEKSIGLTDRNKLGCDTKSCVDNGSSSAKSANSQSTQNNGTEKLIIVYAEKPNKNNIYFQERSSPQIILPTNEPEVKSDIITDESSTAEEPQQSESSIDAKVVPGDEKRDRGFVPHKYSPHRFTPQKKEPQREPNLKLEDRKQNLGRLFAKHRPSPLLSRKKSAQEQPTSSEEDIESAASNLDEIQSGIAINDSKNSHETPKVLENEEAVGDNSTSSQKAPFRSPPRHLVSRPTKPVEKQTSKSALELLKRRPQSKVQPQTGVNAEDAMMIADVAKMMEEINLKAINDMMKTNFTPAAEVPQPPKTPLKSQNSVTPNRRNPNIMSRNRGSTLLSRGAVGSLTTDQETKPNSTPAVNVKESTQTRKLPQRPKIGSQSPSVKPTKVQPPTTSSSEESPAPKDSHRKPPFTRIRTRPAKSSDSSDTSTATPEVTSPPATKPTNVNRRVVLRQRTNTNHVEEKLTVSTEQPEQAIPDHLSSALPEESTSEQQKSDQDLDGSGSDWDPQEFQPQKFAAPAMETGFQPMIQSRGLSIVGPIPGGFHDPALGFNPADEIGLELPPPEGKFESEFNSPGNFNNNRQSLLPPVFPVAQPPTAPTPQLRTNFQKFSSQPSPAQQQSNFQKFTSIDNSMLLPPVQLPVPLNENRPQQQPDLTHIQREFNQLKGQYDTLLSRYADTLNIYIGQYKKLFNSSPPTIR